MNDWLAFDNYAQSVKTAAEKRAEKAALTRKEKRERARAEQEQRFDERDELSKAYRAARRKDLEKLLSNEAFGLRCQELMKFLRRMKISDSKELLARVSEPWLLTAPQWVRFEVLRRIAHHIMRVREGEGLAPIDDPIPWLNERPGVFQIIKERLNVDDWKG